MEVADPTRTRRKHARLLLTVAGITALVAQAVGVAQAHADVHQAPGSISSDCSRDVTAELNAWIGSVPDHSTLVLRPNACYRVDRAVHIAGRNGLVLEGNGATLRSMRNVDLAADTNGGDAILQLERGSNLQILDLNIVGPHPDYDDFNRYASHLPGIRVRGVNTVLFDSISVSFVWGDFIELKANINGMPRNYPSQNVTITNSSFNRSGRQGINISSAENVFVKGNVIKNAHFSAIDQEAVQGGAVARNVTITANEIVGPDTMKFLTSTHKTLTTVNWMVSHNKLSNVAFDVTFYSAADNPKQRIEIIDNTSETPGGTVVRLYAVHGARVEGNSAPLRQGKVAAEIQSVRDVVIRDNVFKGATELLVVDRGVWLEEPYSGPASTNYATCNNVISATGGPAADGQCQDITTAFPEAGGPATPTPAPTAPATKSPPTPTPASAVPQSGYRMVTGDGSVYTFGDAQWFGNASAAGAAVDIEGTPSGNGYWITTDRGQVFAFGDAPYLGGVTGLVPGEAVTSISASRNGRGYWIFTTAGRVLSFGEAKFLGDMSGVRLNGPVLDSIPTPTGRGYFMVASDGGIFTFGDARFVGSMGGHALSAPVQSLVPDPDGDGYWLVASDGGIFAFNADFHGSMGAVRLNRPISGMVGSATGYLMLAEDGGVFSFGAAPFHGSLGDNPPPSRLVAVAALPG